MTGWYGFHKVDRYQSAQHRANDLALVSGLRTANGGAVIQYSSYLMERPLTHVG
jgi:hypothetical protein